MTASGPARYGAGGSNGAFVGGRSVNPRCFPAGSLDGDPGIRPAGHGFVHTKAPWFEITDDLPQFAGMPPVA